MPNILTPLQIWNNFDDSAKLDTEEVSATTDGDIKIESVYFYGRDTGFGRVKIFAKYANSVKNPATGSVLIIPDSRDTVNDGVLKMFAEHGVAALMVDIRGVWKTAKNYTVYPEVIGYANAAKCGRTRDFVDTSADKTCWYEWVSVGIFARKFLAEKQGNENIALVGIRDGGEVAWKLAVAKSFSCLIAVCAAGWKAYAGISKFSSEEVHMDDERYRFIGGIDSQAYAPYVRCPVLMLCSSNDERFDYDRAYDTFSRINPEFAQDSVITYSVQCNASIGVKSVEDMFLFIDKYVKRRQVFIPKPAEITVFVDEEQNLCASAVFDTQGVVENCQMFMAEECLDSALREWTICPEKKKSSTEQQFYLNIYEKSSLVFAICYVKYSSGFTVWSKLAVRKISGKFRNMKPRCRVIYTAKDGTDGFSILSYAENAVGGIFIVDGLTVPECVEKAKGVKGIFYKGGLTTFRINNPRFAPDPGSVLKLDMFSDEGAGVVFEISNLSNGEVYTCEHYLVGGIWQNLLLDCKSFKNSAGASLPGYSSDLRFSLRCNGNFAITNVMWL